MKLAVRMSRIGESATMRVASRASELRAQGIDIVDFGAGEPDYPSPAVAVEAARRALADGVTKYTVLSGDPDLRRALAASYRRRYDSPWGAEGEVLVTVGAKAALLEIALALFGEGREVVIPSPCWVSIPEQVRLAGAEPVMVAARKDDDFRVRAPDLLAAFTEATRAVILNSPCNPTGGIIEADDLRRLVEACAEQDVVVISDETYERFLYDGRQHASVASLAREFPDTVALVGSFSKTYAMTGWRVGFALGPRWLIQAATVIQGHATSNATSFAMPGALAALEGAAAEVEVMVTEYEARRDLLVAGLRQIEGVACPSPAGAFYAFPDVSACYGDGRRGSAAFSEFLLDETRVAVVPGIAFGDDDHVRLSFACARSEIERGLERLQRVL